MLVEDGRGGGDDEGEEGEPHPDRVVGHHLDLSLDAVSQCE